ncbi:MAG: hypothetical protein QMD01_04265 [Thermodesulfovibrionales bacterium]|nr:hypothetical protein [Thermodesulfovibrionales bacterium]
MKVVMSRLKRLKRFRLPLLAVMLYVLAIPLFFLWKSSEDDLKSLRVRQREFNALISEYKSTKENVNALEKAVRARKTTGIAQTVDEIFLSIGIKGKVKNIKSAGTRDIGYSIIEEKTDILLEKLTMNELVNMLYKMEESQFIFSVKKADMKKAFEAAELLDVMITVSFFTAK